MSLSLPRLAPMKLPLHIVSCSVFVLVVFGGPITELRAGRWPGEAVPTPSWSDVRSGAFVKDVERRLEARTTLEDIARPRYNEARFILLGTTSQGVAVGPDDWLFLGQKLADPGERNRRAMARSAKAMGRIQELLAERGTSFVHALLPRAYTVYPDEVPRDLPSPFTPLYGELRQLLVDEGVTVPDLLPALQRADERTYLNNDSHWRPSGAHAAAEELARFIQDDLLEGRPVPGRSVNTRFVRRDPKPFVGQTARRLGFSKGGLLQRRFTDQIRPYDVVDAESPTTIYQGAAEQQPIQFVGTSMSMPPYWFGSQLIGFLGKDISIHARAGYPTGYRMLDRVRLWITGARPWPEILVWEIPEDFFPWQGRYIFEPLDSIVELLEGGPFDPTPIPFDRVEVTGFARTTPAENGIRGSATAEARITLDLEEEERLGDGDAFVVDATIVPGTPPFATQLTARWIAPDGSELGSRKVHLRATKFLHPIAVVLDLEEGQQVARIVIEPSARKASVEVGGFELWRAQPGEGR